MQRLGIQTKLDGRWLADSQQSSEFIQRLSETGIDATRLEIKPNYHPIEEMVLADGKTRTVFGGYIKILFTEKQWNPPQEGDIASTDLVLLDPFLGAESELCADYCIQHAKPYLTIDHAPESKIARNAHATLISEEFLLREYKTVHDSGQGWEEIFLTYLDSCPGWVIFTFGGEPLWYAPPRTSAIETRAKRTFQPYPVKVVDTTGAGDSFRAGFAYALLQGKQGEEAIQTACAVAGLVCTKFPGVLQSPTEAELSAFF